MIAVLMILTVSKATHAYQNERRNRFTRFNSPTTTASALLIRCINQSRAYLMPTA